MSVECAFELQPDPDRPNVLRFEWTLLSGDASLVPGGALRPTRRLYFAIHDRLRTADHAPPAPADWRARKSIGTTGLSTFSDVRSRHRLRHSTLCETASPTQLNGSSRPSGQTHRNYTG